MQRHAEGHGPARLGELGAGLTLAAGAVLDEERGEPAQGIGRAWGLALGEPPEALADARGVLESLGDLQRLGEGAVGEERLVAVLDGLRMCPEAEEARGPGAGTERLRMEARDALQQLLRLRWISRALPGLGALE